jgi:phosphatidate cytidylyltransferase
MASDFEAFEAQLRETNDKINARTGRPLFMAIIVGLVLGVSLLLSLLVWKPLFMVFAGVLIGFTTYELASALRRSGRDIPRIPLLIVSLAIVPAAFFWGGLGQWLMTLAAMVIVTVWRLVEVAAPGNRVPGATVARDIGGGVFVVAYVGFLASFSVLLTAQDGGQWWTLAFLIVVVAIDTGAYASGLAFGKHPMAPTISPKKSWEGFAGAAVVAVVAGILLALFMLGQPWWVGLILGLTMLATGTMGDLAESLIKRDLGIKDIGSLLPGHGGFLDRLDSAIPSGVAAFGLFLIFA